MKIAKMVEMAKGNLGEGEEFKGMFLGASGNTTLMAMLFGALAAATIKQYVVSISDSKLYFNKLDFWGRPDSCDSFANDEVDKVEYKKGLLNHNVNFYFKNGNSLKLRAQFNKKSRAPFLNQGIVDYLAGRF